MYYAEEQYFVDQYKKNKNAFKDVKDELLLTLERENATKLNLVICYDDENRRLLQHYDRTTYPVDYSHPFDANRESYNIVKECNSSVIFDDPNDVVYLYRLAIETPLLYAKFALKENGLQNYVDAMNWFNY